MKIIFAMVKRMIPAVATRGRLLSMAVVGAIGIAIGIVLRQAELEVADLDQYVASFGFTIFVPLVALVISTATLGSLREDKNADLSVASTDRALDDRCVCGHRWIDRAAAAHADPHGCHRRNLRRG